MSFILLIFYEALWMLLDSSSGIQEVLPSVLELGTDALACTLQVLPGCVLVFFERRKKILMKKKRKLHILVVFLFLVNLCVAQPITLGEVQLYESIHSVSWDWFDHLLNDFMLSMFSTLILTIQVLQNYIEDLQTLTDKRVKEQKLLSETKLIALQNQVDPHFLFNCLSAAISLIELSASKAKMFITDLAEVYRYQLQSSKQSYVPIEMELRNLNVYMNLMSIRYENAIRLTVDPSLSASKTNIPRCALQMLVENAIKHNVKSISRPLHIRIGIEDSYYVVENDYRPIHNSVSSAIGEKNIEERYAALGNADVKFCIENNKYIVKIPIIQNENINY